MRSLAVEVPRSEGELTRRWLADRRLIRTDLRIARGPGVVQIPVSASVAVPGGTARLVDADFLPKSRKGPQRFRDQLSWPAPELENLPRSFDVIGDVVVIRLPPQLGPRAEQVGQALLEFVPHARVVGWDHGVHGPERKRRITRIAGAGPFRTIHRENGLSFDVDLDQAYFSPRLAREHARVASAARSGELVYDLCCGIGPFGLTIAHRGRAARVVAVDANPAAVELLRLNLARQRPRVPVEANVSDLGWFLETAEPADRIVLNLPLEGIKYVTSVGRVVRPEGTLHFYDVTPRAAQECRAGELTDRLAAGGGAWALLAERRVHPYSPDADVRVYDFARREVT